MQREDVIQLAREAGIKASVGKTDKDGKYHPYVNALGRDIPIEWLERFANAIEQRTLERAARTCEDKALNMECRADELEQEAGDSGEYYDASNIRSAAWHVSNCADAIRALKEQT